MDKVFIPIPENNLASDTNSQIKQCKERGAMPINIGERRVDDAKNGNWYEFRLLGAPVMPSIPAYLDAGSDVITESPKNSRSFINLFLGISIFIIGVFICSLTYAVEKGQVTGLPLPRFVSLKFNETNLRKGPGSKYPIMWVYKIKSYPIEVTAEFESWRRLRDADGTEGWVHENLITGGRSAIISSNNYIMPNPNFEKHNRELIIFRYPNEASYPMARAEIGVLVKLRLCDYEWCKIEIEDITGWVRKSNLWGVYPEELIK